MVDDNSTPDEQAQSTPAPGTDDAAAQGADSVNSAAPPTPATPFHPGWPNLPAAEAPTEVGATPTVGAGDPTAEAPTVVPGVASQVGPAAAPFVAQEPAVRNMWTGDSTAQVPPAGLLYGEPAPAAGFSGAGGAGSWGMGAPYGAWGPPPTPPKKSKRTRGAIAGIVAGAVLVAAIVGAVIGHSLWSSSSPVASTSPITGGNGGTPSFGSPFSGGSGSTGSGSSGSGGGSSSAAGAPADAAAIAKDTDPGLVDVNVTFSYQQASGAGTGMVLTSDGTVLTNNHVIDGATSISVTDVGNGKTYNATVVGYDRSADIAVLKLSGASGLQTVNLGNSSSVSVGAGVVAVGNAEGLGGTPSYAGGSITATGQSITAEDEGGGSAEQLTGLFQTNAAIVAGDSGGPLVNASSKVIAMDTAAAATRGFQTSSNQGYAIPINQALTIAGQIEAGKGSANVHIGTTAFLGVEVSDAGSSSSIPGFNVNGGTGNSSNNTSTGADIESVIQGSPAAKAGLTAGDTITAVGGQNVTSAESLTTVMQAKSPGQSVQVTYTDSSGAQHTTTVVLGSGPAQ
jgi:S1-C subfamily serine protease